MTREEQIKQAQIAFIGYDRDIDEGVDTLMRRKAFEAGARWADAHQNGAWHKCSDELPKTNGGYLIQCNNGFICTMRFSLPDYWHTLGHPDVKYWMELPNPIKD